MSTTSATPPSASDAFRPVITITALARLVYDSWLNGPHKPIFFPPHLQTDPLPLDIGLPKKTPLSSSSVTPSAATSPSTASSTSSSLQPPEQQVVVPPPKSEKEILREIFKNACWLSNVLHHAMIEAAALGYDIRTSKDNKRVVKFWVFEGEKVNPNEVAHSWNVFQVEDICASACEASSQPPSFCCVDLTIDQFKDSSRLDVPENLITPGFGVFPGTTRLKPDLFKSAGPSKNWIGKEIVVNDVDEIEATTLLWEYFISLLQSHAALAFPGVIPATPPPPRRKSKKKPSSTTSSTTSPMVVPVSPGQVILQFPAPPKEELAQISPENKKKYKKEIAQIEVEVGLFIESCKCLCGNANVDANVGLRAKSFLFSFMEAGVLKTRDLLEP